MLLDISTRHTDTIPFSMSHLGRLLLGLGIHAFTMKIRCLCKVI